MTSGPAAGQSLEIESEIVVGREGADLTIDDAELSRRHLALRPVEGGVEVEDLGSLNGTFVDGERISGPRTLKSSAALRLGTSEARIEVSLPQATRMADTPQVPPGATAARPVADPEATAQRPVVDPNVTAQRPVAEPDRTAQRPVQPAAKGPDVTVQRPAHAAGPPATPPPAAPPEAAEDRGGDGGGPPVPLIAGAVVGVVLLIILAIVLLSGGEADAKKRKIDVRHTVTTLTKEDQLKSELGPGKRPITWTLIGRTAGRPFGNGNITAVASLQPAGPPPGAPKPAKPPSAAAKKKGTVTVKITIRFNNGTIVASERLSNERLNTRSKGGGSIKVNGTGRILRGTGDFEGARGTFKVTGSRPKFLETYETVHWTGTVEY